MNPILNIASRAAINSGSYMLRCLDQLDKPFLRKKNIYIKNYVQNIIVDTIKSSYPDHQIMLEGETVEDEVNGYVWIISVLDGENNYFHNMPMFCISIAVKCNNRIEHGLIYNPSNHEMFTASRNQGAKLNDKRIRLKKDIIISDSIINISIKDLFSNNSQYDMYKITENIQNIFDIRCIGSIALSLAYLSIGRISGYFTPNINLLDAAAGSLIAKESGCYISDYNNGGDFLKVNNIVCAHPRIFPYIIEIIRKNKR